MENTTPKHTPGPWKKHESVQTGEFFVTAGEQDQIHIARTGRHDETSRCDARLIAAAPELLEALEELYDSVDSCVEFTPEKLWKARMAIAKAKGEQ